MLNFLAADSSKFFVHRLHTQGVPRLPALRVIIMVSHSIARFSESVVGLAVPSAFAPMLPECKCTILPPKRPKCHTTRVSTDPD